jgi:2'-hydroxyisoflavone reductase
MAAMDGRALHVRAGLIVGPHDPTDRFTYWPYRVAKGGEIVAPGEPDYPVQFVAVRDIAAWTVRATEAKLTGPYNVTGPDYQLTMQHLLRACRQVSGSEAVFTWINDAFLLERQVTPFTEMPLWLPNEYIGLSLVNCNRAIAAGLAFRPLAETIHDTLAWQATWPAERQWRNGLSRDRETELLQAWHKRGTGEAGTDLQVA